MDLNSHTADFTEWIPIRAFRGDAGLCVDWCYMGSTRFTHPFFEDTVSVQFRRPFSLLFRRKTPIDLLKDLYETSPGVPPTGFIFHMSRCGSTLVSQMLASLPANIVMSEPPVIDSVIRAEAAGDEERVNRLRWVVIALGQRRDGSEQNYFIKFDSWSTIDLALIRRAFPDVPWIFLYRDPVEVIVSQMRQRGAQMIPGFIGGFTVFAGEDIFSMPPEVYCARLLAAFCRGALDFAGDKTGMFVNYTQLPTAIDEIARHFGAGFTPDEIGQMLATTEFDAKSPRMFFEPDSEKKKNAASDAVHEAAAEWLDPLYRQLEEARMNREATV
jgi:hypothetical protein